jgi:hypothetical protein
MPNRHLRLLAAVTLLTAGCAYRPTPIELQAEPADVAAMAGTWEGTYVGRESGRSGTILFTLAAGKDSAYGDVLMESAWPSQIVAADMASGEHSLHARAPHLLLIRFVAIRGGFVEGMLEPYVAPDCQCTVNTVFRGYRDGERISGDFTTRGPMGLLQKGKWNARRTKTTIAER